MGGGGGGMMKTVHRAVRAGTGGRGSSQEPFSHSTTRTNTNHKTTTNSPTSRPTYKLSSSSNHTQSPNYSSVNHPNWANSPPLIGDDVYDDFVFCTAPSMDEVNYAVSSLQQVLDPATSPHDSGWELQARGSGSVYDAFRLLQTEPSVKRMVISLSSDKSVWDAVMKNEVVRELRDSVNEANNNISGRSGKAGSIQISDVIDWIFNNMKAKAIEMVENIIETMNKLFQSPRNETNARVEEGAAIEPFEKKLRSSFMLTVMVLLIVFVSRVRS